LRQAPANAGKGDKESENYGAVAVCQEINNKLKIINKKTQTQK